MEALSVTVPVSPELSSTERIRDHLTIMRKLKRILEDAEHPGRHADRFPPPPAGVSGQEQEGKWRVQCLLMSAEVRYSRYLDMLARWMEYYGDQRPKDQWPLPPWDVAIIFYAHLLSPFNFHSDTTTASNFGILWRAEIEFPLARMCSINTDNASERVWMGCYPNIPYQTVEFTPTEDHAYITAENALDIQGYRCGSKHCNKKEHVIRMVEWSKYRVGQAKLICPGCKTTFTNRETNSENLRELSRAMFGFPVFDLWDSPQRQFGKQGLVDRILALTQVQGPIPDHTSRYLKFLQLMKEGKSTLVPTLDIDLLWHTHQLSPVAYGKYCKTQVGRHIDHVDTIRTVKRSTGEDDTARLWAIRYGESYFDPENTAKKTGIERCKATCKQKQEDMEAKLAAYDYSHQYIEKGLDEACDRLADKYASTLHDTYTARSALDEAIPNVEKAKMSVKPALRLFRLRYYSRSQKQQMWELEDKRRSLVEEAIQKQRELETLEDEVAREYEPDCKEWEAAQKEAQKARRLLEQQLAAEVTLATEAIWQQQQQQYQEDRYDATQDILREAAAEEEAGDAVEEAGDAVEEVEEEKGLAEEGAAGVGAGAEAEDAAAEDAAAEGLAGEGAAAGEGVAADAAVANLDEAN